MADLSEKERWIAENTFECGIGRVSLAQCQRNRERPDFGEPGFGPFKSSICAHCKNWAFLCKSVLIKDFSKEKEVAMSLEAPGMPACESPGKILCDCGEQFEPYKRGIVTVKKMCPACLGKKTSPAKIETSRGEEESAGASSAGNAPLEIRVRFDGDDRRLHDSILEVARRERRTPADQVLWWVEHYAPEIAACGDAGGG